MNLAEIHAGKDARHRQTGVRFSERKRPCGHRRGRPAENLRTGRRRQSERRERLPCRQGKSAESYSRCGHESNARPRQSAGSGKTSRRSSCKLRRRVVSANAPIGRAARFEKISGGKNDDAERLQTHARSADYRRSAGAAARNQTDGVLSLRERQSKRDPAKRLRKAVRYFPCYRKCRACEPKFDHRRSKCSPLRSLPFRCALGQEKVRSLVFINCRPRKLVFPGPVFACISSIGTIYGILFQIF